jgi:putative component of membrane protein insertase Oxa1/YidC/SpoIIIJ protein YidD
MTIGQCMFSMLALVTPRHSPTCRTRMMTLTRVGQSLVAIVGLKRPGCALKCNSLPKVGWDGSAGSWGFPDADENSLATILRAASEQ